ncbi:MAG: hypothetical protein RMK74_15550, partial [Myxococcales bacterium]|nr:hypothetical protein [Myxococcales bacterium]
MLTLLLLAWLACSMLGCVESSTTRSTDRSLAPSAPDPMSEGVAARPLTPDTAQPTPTRDRSAWGSGAATPSLLVASHGAPRMGAPGRRPRAPSGETYFLGQSESAVLRALATEPVVHAVKGSGGRSLAFKLTLADGTVGYFKPSQTFSASRWWSEVVSHYLDRALGLGRVPPTVSRRLPWAPLAQAAAGDRRLGE